MSDRESGWPPRRILGVALMSGGGLILLVGLFWAGMYVYGVVDVLGEPDRSWVFWGLAIFLLGSILMAIGSVLLVVGRELIRASRRGSEPSHDDG